MSTVTVTEKSSTLTAYGSELAIPTTFHVVVEGFPFAVSADCAADIDGPRVVSLTIAQVEGGDPVTTDALRSIPLARLLRSAVGLAAYAPLRTKEGEVLPWDEGIAGFPSDEELQRAEREVPASGRRWLMTDEHLSNVAKVYKTNPRNALGQRAPTQAVMQHFNVTRPTAGRWVMEARKRGFLPPASEKGDKLPTTITKKEKKQ